MHLAPRPSTADRQRRRTAVLAALYCVVAVLADAHLLWHDHHAAHHGGPPTPAVASAACDGHCDHPGHHHHASFDEGACLLCKSLGQRDDVLLPPRSGAPAIVVCGEVDAAQCGPRCPERSGPGRARGPPLFV